MKAIKRFLILALFAVFALPAAPSDAQKFLDNFKKPMPEIPLMPEEEFKKATTDYKDTPFGDKALAYEVRLPSNWKRPRDTALTTFSVSTKVLGELARFDGPPDLIARSYFTVKAINLDYSQTAEQWLMQYIIANAYTIQGLKIKDEKSAEVMYVSMEKDVTYVVHAHVQINGRRVIMAQYVVPADYWEEQKQMQAQCIANFKLLNPVEETIEPLLKHLFLDIAEFSYPDSWEIKVPPLKSIDRMTAQLLNVASEEIIKKKKYKTLNGKMEVELISYYVVESIENEIEDYKFGLAREGLLIQDTLPIETRFNLHKNMSLHALQAYRVLDSKDTSMEYELWLTLLEAGDYYYLVALITPSREDAYAIWARNTQTFKLVAENIKPLENSLTGER